MTICFSTNDFDDFMTTRVKVSRMHYDCVFGTYHMYLKQKNCQYFRHHDSVVVSTKRGLKVSPPSQ
jgi:hypothetical protein